MVGVIGAALGVGRSQGRSDFAYAWFELLRRAGLRVGAIRGMLRRRPKEWAA